MPLEVTIKRVPGQKIVAPVNVTLVGSLDTATAPGLEKKLEPILAAGDTKEVVFDLAGLNFISSAGLRIFAGVRKKLHERNGKTIFVHMQPQIQEVFKIIQALPGYSVFASVQELDEYLAKRQEAIINEGKS